MTFLLSEDQALKLLLQGVTVTDQKSTGDGVARQVGVWFGQPDQELRAQAYPYITIDMVGIARDPEREMRGKVKPVYINPPANLISADDWDMHLPIPVNIDYQVTTYARHPRHDRELLAQVLFTKLPLRFGQLDIDDGTVRRLEVTDVAKRDVTEQAKRLFVNSITVRVSSEIPETVFTGLTQVASVKLTTENTTKIGL